MIARITFCRGFSDSPAATAAISLPPRENITTMTPAMTGDRPLGMNPSWAVRLTRPGEGMSLCRPSRIEMPSSMKMRMVATFMAASQYSTSANERTE
ncbi:hypothetical protein O162_33495 [Pseudomonas putida SJ3]|nr:hypothetical protein O162_33495 [Pseudomonas putida SJ3]